MASTEFFAECATTIIRRPLACGASACLGSLGFGLVGVGVRCIGAPSSSWSASLSSPTSFPEPASLGLLGLGLLVVATRRRRIG